MLQLSYFLYFYFKDELQMGKKKNKFYIYFQGKGYTSHGKPGQRRCSRMENNKKTHTI